MIFLGRMIIWMKKPEREGSAGERKVQAAGELKA